MADSEHLDIRKVEETEFADSSSLNDFSHYCIDYYQKYMLTSFLVRAMLEPSSHLDVLALVVT
jgi:hypothetical protein